MYLEISDYRNKKGLPHDVVIEYIRLSQRFYLLKDKDESTLTLEELEEKRLGLRARNKIIEENLLLIGSTMQEALRLGLIYARSDEDLRDIYQEGVFGLEHAVRKFDPKKGCCFSTYARQWIGAAIRKSAKCQTVIQVKIHIYQKRFLIEKATEALVRKGVKPTVKNIYQYLRHKAECDQTKCLSEKQIASCLEATKKMYCLSLDQSRKTCFGSINDSNILLNLVSDNTSTVLEDNPNREKVYRAVREAISHLSPLESEVITRFAQGEKLSSIASDLNYQNYRQVVKIKKRALEQIKSYLEGYDLPTIM